MVAIRPVNGQANVRAYVDVRLGDIVIKNAKVVRQPGQRAWVAMPDVPYVVNGKTRYAPVIELDKSLRERVTATVLAKWGGDECA